MTRTAREQEAYLISQYFNGSYVDADHSCSCSNNRPTENTAPKPKPPVTNTPTENNAPTGGAPATVNQQNGTESPVTDATNNPAYPNTAGNLGTVTPTSDEIISNALPTFPSTDVSAQSGAAPGGSGNGTEKPLNTIPPALEEPSNAGGWLLAVIASGLILRKLMKGGKNDK